MSYQCDPRCAEVMAERDALRAENEKLKRDNVRLLDNQAANVEIADTHVERLEEILTLKAHLAEQGEYLATLQAKLVEAERVIHLVKSYQGVGVVWIKVWDAARAYLAKYKKQGE